MDFIFDDQKMIMKHISSLLVLLMVSGFICSQSATVEIMPGNNYVHYQHNMVQNLEKKFGLQYIASYLKKYPVDNERKNKKDELMNQVYITAGISNKWTAKAGFFYTSASGYKASLALQYVLSHQHLMVVIIPRIDLVRKGSVELFSIVEWRPAITPGVQAYFRLQIMSNASLVQHHRSYQLIRAGIQRKNMQMGAGINFDEYSVSGTVYANAGLFLRKTF